MAIHSPSPIIIQFASKFTNASFHRCSSIRITRVPYRTSRCLCERERDCEATASPARSGTFSSTGNQPGTLLLDPPSARDEERVHGIKDFGLETKFATLLTKSKQAVMHSIVHTTLVLKLGWWRTLGVHPSIVYTNLKLDQVKGNILTNSKFRAWVKYVDSYNPYHPGKEVSILAKLEEQFNAYRLAWMLTQAKRAAQPSIRNLGTRLHKEQMEIWRNSLLSSTPNDVHVNPKLEPRMRYAHKYREKKGTDVTLDDIIASLLESDKIKIFIRTAHTEDEEKLAENLKKKLAKKLAAT